MSRTKGTKETDSNSYPDRSAHFALSEEFLDQQKEKDWPALEPQLRGFAEEYCFNGYNHREAAEEVGINPDRGIKLKREPLIRAYIAHIQDKLFEANIVTRDFVDAKLDELYDMAVGEIDTTHIDTKMAESFAAKKFHGSLALDILKEKAKMNGIVTTDTEDPGEGGSHNEIHFHVKEKKSSVRITRGKRKTTAK